MRYRRTRARTSPLARRRRIALFLRGALVLLFVSGVVLGVVGLSHWEGMTIQNVAIYGAASVAAADIEQVARQTIDGTYPLYLSRSNIILYPFLAVRERILREFPKVASVDIAREDLTTISIAVKEREPFALWCGENVLPPEEAVGTCYFLDDGGFVFTKAPDFTGSVFFRYYGVLPSEPLGSRFLPEERFRTMTLFLSELETATGRTPIALALVDLDVEVYFEEGGRMLFESDQDLTQILANAKAALNAEAISRSRLELDYVDLRFGNRAYFRFRD